MILSGNNIISSLPKNAKRSGTIMPNTGTDETRNDILSSAKKLFFTEGYEKTTLRTIAKSTGKEVGLIYYYFKNKEQLFSSVIGVFGDEYEACVTDYLNAASGDKIVALSDFIFETKNDFLSFYENTDNLVKKVFRDEMLSRIFFLAKPIIENSIEADEHTIQTLTYGFVYGVAGAILSEENVDYSLLLEKLFS